MRLLTALLVMAFFLASAVAQEPVITADSALLFDANTGKVLFKKNENVQRPVASTQKLLTALIIAESGDLSDLVTITKSDTLAEPTKLYLKEGTSYSRMQLLTALLIKSPNDVARALARDNAGDIEAFAAKMNAKMLQLGGKSSNFMNPNGLPIKGQYSTARDMARVARAAYFNQALRTIMKTKFYNFKFTDGKTMTLKNTNRVLRAYSFCNGMKTGYTDKARHCLVSSGSWNGKEVISVVFGTSKAKIWPESTALLVYGLGIPTTELAALRLPDNAEH